MSDFFEILYALIVVVGFAIACFIIVLAANAIDRRERRIQNSITYQQWRARRKECAKILDRARGKR